MELHYERDRNTTPLAPNYTFTFKFEEDFDPDLTKQWMVRNWHYAVYTILVYLLVVYSGKAYMKNRPPYGLRIPMFCWNTTLSIFSLIGTMRTWPEFMHVIREFGFTYSVCNPSYMTVCKVSGFWSWLFALSKAPELLDTLFIVARKRKLTFLHIYHHITVFVFLWYGYSREYGAVGRWYVNLNYFVHSWMYAYYAVTSLGVRLPRFVSMSVTTLQIVQMIVAFLATFLAYETKRRGQFCYISKHIVYIALFIVFSYAVLFLRYFYHAYIVSALQLRHIEKQGEKIFKKTS